MVKEKGKETKRNEKTNERVYFSLNKSKQNKSFVVLGRFKLAFGFYRVEWEYALSFICSLNKPKQHQQQQHQQWHDENKKQQQNAQQQ